MTEMTEEKMTINQTDNTEFSDEPVSAEEPSEHREQPIEAEEGLAPAAPDGAIGAPASPEVTPAPQQAAQTAAQPAPKEPTSAPEKEPSAAEELITAAKILGISEGAMQTGYIRHQADKLFERVGINVLGQNVSYAEAVRKLGEAASFKMNCATVSPTLLPHAKKLKTELDIFVAVGYPYGDLAFSDKVYLLKKAYCSSNNAELCFDVRAAKEVKRAVLLREYKKLAAIGNVKSFSGKRRRLRVSVDVTALTPDEMATVVEVLHKAGVKEVKATLDSLSKDEIALRAFLAAANGKFEKTVVSVSRADDTEKVIEVFNLAEGLVITCDDAVEIVKSFKEQLKI